MEARHVFRMMVFALTAILDYRLNQEKHMKNTSLNFRNLNIFGIAISMQWNPLT